MRVITILCYLFVAVSVTHGQIADDSKFLGKQSVDQEDIQPEPATPELQPQPQQGVAAEEPKNLEQRKLQDIEVPDPEQGALILEASPAELAPETTDGGNGSEQSSEHPKRQRKSKQDRVPRSNQGQGHDWYPAGEFLPQPQRWEQVPEQGALILEASPELAAEINNEIKQDRVTRSHLGHGQGHDWYPAAESLHQPQRWEPVLAHHQGHGGWYAGPPTGIAREDNFIVEGPHHYGHGHGGFYPGPSFVKEEIIEQSNHPIQQRHNWYPAPSVVKEEVVVNEPRFHPSPVFHHGGPIIKPGGSFYSSSTTFSQGGPPLRPRGPPVPINRPPQIIVREACPPPVVNVEQPPIVLEQPAPVPFVFGQTTPVRLTHHARPYYIEHFETPVVIDHYQKPVVVNHKQTPVVIDHYQEPEVLEDSLPPPQLVPCDALDGGVAIETVDFVAPVGPIGYIDGHHGHHYHGGPSVVYEQYPPVVKEEIITTNFQSHAPGPCH